MCGSCNTLNDLSNKTRVLNKIKDLDLSKLSMITGINKSKKLIKHVSCELKCKCDVWKCNSIKNGIMINDDASVENIYVKKDYLWNPATCSCKNGHYLLSNIDGSVITCDEITDAKETKTIPKGL